MSQQVANAEALDDEGAGDAPAGRDPQLYVAVSTRDRIARVPPSHRLRTVIEGRTLSLPSKVVLDPAAKGTAFVRNFPPSAPERAGVLRTHP